MGYNLDNSSAAGRTVLYLDADALVEGDLKEWDTDLEGKAIAAAPDVDLPARHDAEGFNGSRTSTPKSC